MAASFGKLHQLKPGLLLVLNELLSRLLPRGKRTNDVLVVRIDAIGDFVVWLDAARALVEFYAGQDRRVVLAANALWAEWARELGLFSEVIPVNRRLLSTSVRYRTQIATGLRRYGFATAILPSYFREFLGDALIALSGAPERIGSTGDRANMRGWQTRMEEHGYTRLLPASPESMTEHERNAEFVRHLVDPGYQATLGDLRWLRDSPLPAPLAGTLHGAPFFALTPGASQPIRKWPAVKYAALAARIYRATGWTPVLCGSPDDRELAAAIRSHAELEVPFLDLTGRTSVSEMVHCLAHARLVLANDSAAAHIGPATGTPTLCLLGGGHYDRFLPYAAGLRTQGQPLPVCVIHPMPCFRCNWQCIYPVPAGAPAPCVEGIDLEDAWDTVQRLLT